MNIFSMTSEDCPTKHAHSMQILSNKLVTGVGENEVYQYIQFNLYFTEVLNQ